jgi:Terminase large subunit, T4likevirus-type, N-terminal
MMAETLAMGLDPVRMARRAGINPDPWQAAVLRRRAHQTILLCTRQGGKSLVTALLSAHEAIYHPPALVLLFARAKRQSELLYQKVRHILRDLGQAATGYEKETEAELLLTNGSRIVCLPGNEATTRGYSGVALLVIDEASRCPDLLYAAVRPMLAVSAGRLVLLSTPFGRRGFFFETWTGGGPNWHRVKVTADECPRITPGFLAEERQQLPERAYRTEYFCSFEDLDSQVFPTDLVLQAFTSDVQPLFAGGVR